MRSRSSSNSAYQFFTVSPITISKEYLNEGVRSEVNRNPLLIDFIKSFWIEAIYTAIALIAKLKFSYRRHERF